MDKLPFTPDSSYKRSSLHDQFGGNRQSGISPSAINPFIFIFSGKSGAQYGYRDGWDNKNVLVIRVKAKKGICNLSKVIWH